jgi:DNA repair exonuclease SbcCD nuclease subunit
MLKIVHIADLHLGLQYSKYPENIRQQLIEESSTALHRIIRKANEAHAHVLVVAGDLFDHLRVPKALVCNTKAALGNFEGEVIIIPGNHDYYEPGNDKCWHWFGEAPGDNIHLLHDFQPFSIEMASRNVIFYPCGCRSRHGTDHLLEWVRKETKDDQALHIGLAHGNVQGLGIDDEGRYFNMSPHDFKDCGIHFWLLGHIHAPYPKEDNGDNMLFYFSGNHAANSWKTERPGGCWYLEVNSKNEIKGRRWHTEGIGFADRQYTLTNEIEIESAFEKLFSLNQKTILRVVFNGNLSSEQKAMMLENIQALEKHLLHMVVTNQTILRLQRSDIDGEFMTGTVPHLLLTGLIDEGNDDECIQLAYQSIKELSS